MKSKTSPGTCKTREALTKTPWDTVGFGYHCSDPESTLSRAPLHRPVEAVASRLKPPTPAQGRKEGPGSRRWRSWPTVLRSAEPDGACGRGVSSAAPYGSVLGAARDRPQLPTRGLAARRLPPAPTLSPEDRPWSLALRELRDVPAPKIPGTPTAQTGVPAASRTGAQRLALGHRSSRARLRFRAEPGRSRSSGCGERPGGLGPAPPRAAGLRVGRGRGPGGSARTRPRRPGRRAQVEVLRGSLDPRPTAGATPSYAGKGLGSGAPPGSPVTARPSLPASGAVGLFQFLSSTLLDYTIRLRHAPAANPAGGPGEICGPRGFGSGPLGPGTEEGGRPATSRSGRCAGRPERGGGSAGPACLPVCRSKAAEAAETRWRPSTRCKQNQTKRGERKSEMALLKMEPRPRGRLSLLLRLLLRQLCFLSFNAPPPLGFSPRNRYPVTPLLFFLTISFPPFPSFLSPLGSSFSILCHRRFSSQFPFWARAPPPVPLGVFCVSGSGSGGDGEAR
ncbi:hypothetical protein AB1E18_009727 [Capra hircus]